MARDALAKVTCPHCAFDFLVAPERDRATCPKCLTTMGLVEESQAPKGEDLEELRCPDCSGVILVSPAEAEGDCPHCGSHLEFIPPEEAARRAPAPTAAAREAPPAPRPAPAPLPEAVERRAAPAKAEQGRGEKSQRGPAPAPAEPPRREPAPPPRPSRAERAVSQPSKMPPPATTKAGGGKLRVDVTLPLPKRRGAAKAPAREERLVSEARPVPAAPESPRKAPAAVAPAPLAPEPKAQRRGAIPDKPEPVPVPRAPAARRAPAEAPGAPVHSPAAPPAPPAAPATAPAPRSAPAPPLPFPLLPPDHEIGVYDAPLVELPARSVGGAPTPPTETSPAASPPTALPPSRTAPLAPRPAEPPAEALAPPKRPRGRRDRHTPPPPPAPQPERLRIESPPEVVEALPALPEPAPAGAERPLDAVLTPQGLRPAADVAEAVFDVECPSCGETLRVSEDLVRGECFLCGALLDFEDVYEEQGPPSGTPEALADEEPVVAAPRPTPPPEVEPVAAASQTFPPPEEEPAPPPRAPSAREPKPTGPVFAAEDLVAEETLPAPSGPPAPARDEEPRVPPPAEPPTARRVAPPAPPSLQFPHLVLSPSAEVAPDAIPLVEVSRREAAGEALPAAPPQAPEPVARPSRVTPEAAPSPLFVEETIEAAPTPALEKPEPAAKGRGWPARAAAGRPSPPVDDSAFAPYVAPKPGRAEEVACPECDQAILVDPTWKEVRCVNCGAFLALQAGPAPPAAPPTFTAAAAEPAVAGAETGSRAAPEVPVPPFSRRKREEPIPAPEPAAAAKPRRSWLRREAPRAHAGAPPTGDAREAGARRPFTFEVGEELAAAREEPEVAVEEEAFRLEMPPEPLHAAELSRAPPSRRAPPAPMRAAERIPEPVRASEPQPVAPASEPAPVARRAPQPEPFRFEVEETLSVEEPEPASAGEVLAARVPEEPFRFEMEEEASAAPEPGPAEPLGFGEPEDDWSAFVVEERGGPDLEPLDSAGPREPPGPQPTPFPPSPEPFPPPGPEPPEPEPEPEPDDDEPEESAKAQEPTPSPQDGTPRRKGLFGRFRRSKEPGAGAPAPAAVPSETAAAPVEPEFAAAEATPGPTSAYVGSGPGPSASPEAAPRPAPARRRFGLFGRRKERTGEPAAPAPPSAEPAPAPAPEAPPVPVRPPAALPPAEPEEEPMAQDTDVGTEAALWPRPEPPRPWLDDEPEEPVGAEAAPAPEEARGPMADTREPAVVAEIAEPARAYTNGGRRMDTETPAPVAVRLEETIDTLIFRHAKRGPRSALSLAAASAGTPGAEPVDHLFPPPRGAPTLPGPTPDRVVTRDGVLYLRADFTHVKGIGPKFHYALHASGLDTYETFLSATPERIAQVSGISPDQASTFQAGADLCRVAGIGEKTAALLRAARVWTLWDLAAEDPDEVAARVNGIRGAHDMTGADLPGAKVREWARQAQKLLP